MYTSGDLHVVTNSHSHADMNNTTTDTNTGGNIVGEVQGTSPNGAVRRVCISKNIDEGTQVQTQNASQLTQNLKDSKDITPDFNSQTQSALAKLRDDQ